MDREGVTTDQLVVELDGLHELTNSVFRRFLAAVVEFDRREAWKEDGAGCLRDWLCYRYGFSVQTARSVVEVGAALEDLPVIASAFEHGLLSQDKVVDLCSFVSPEEDERYATSAVEHNAAQVKVWARHARRVRREEAARQSRERYLRLSWDRQREMLHLSGLLPGADVACVKAAIERLTEQYGPSEDGTWDPPEQRRADALVELAGNVLSLDADTDRATVVLHVDAHELNHIHGMAKVQDGPMASSEVVRRLVCDGRIEPVTGGADAEPLGVGRRFRTVPAWLHRQLMRRDEGCVLCGRTVGLAAHHVVHWAHGGPTDLGNLVMLCRRCHKRVHDDGFRLLRDKDRKLRLIRPDGRPVMNRPSPMRPDLRQRMLGARRQGPQTRSTRVMRN